MLDLAEHWDDLFAAGFDATLMAVRSLAAMGEPQWAYADDGRDILAKPLVVPMSAIPDLDAFTLEATLRFDERTDFTFFPLFDCTVSETGFGLAASDEITYLTYFVGLTACKEL